MVVQMNDLISRAAAIDAIVFNSENRFAVDVLNDVPAVNAIPIEWLCGYLNKIGMKPTDISEMILTWKKEEVNSNG